MNSMTTDVDRIQDLNRLSELSQGEIQEIIPHRDPFLLLDGVTDLVPGQSAKGFKNVSADEYYFKGHFPDLPIMPGVLQTETLAQLCCVVINIQPEYCGKYIGLFTGIDGFKFKRKVVPGDRLELEANVIKFRYPFGKCEVKASVGGELCCSGTISFAMADKSVLSD